jgi:hypothetical protein
MVWTSGGVSRVSLQSTFILAISTISKVKVEAERCQSDRGPEALVLVVEEVEM